MSFAEFDQSTCGKDGLCARVCPLGLIEIGPDTLPRVVARADDDCIACGHCVAVCPRGAITNERLPQGARERTQARQAAAPAVVTSLLKARRSHREFREAPLTHAELAELLDVARYAPTAGNSRLVRWIVSEEPRKTRQLAAMAIEALGTDPAFAELAREFEAGKDGVLRGAPHLLVAVAPSSYRWGDVDCTIAITQLELAALAQGYATCWAGLFVMATERDARLRAALSLPRDLSVRGALMVGRPRLSFSHVAPRTEAPTTWL